MPNLRYTFPAPFGAGNLLLRAALSFVLLIANEIAAGFPEMIASGYQSCKSCHLQPTGGGPINEYGQSIAGEHLSTWSTEGEGENFHGLLGVNFKPFSFGGDFRYLMHHFKDANVEINQRFAMQKEISLIFDPAKNVSIVASAGYYGLEPDEPEFRRYFGIIRLGGLSLRGGRYLPAFGFETDNHTLGIKELFGQSKEALSLETAYTHRYFEVFATRVLGGQSRLEASDRPVVKQKANQDGYTGKFNAFIMKGVQAGYSYASLEDEDKLRTYSGVHAFVGTELFYSMAEFQWHPLDAYRAYGMLGVQVLKGLHLKAELDADEKLKEFFATAVWFPRPHFQFTASASQRQALFISHYYL